MKLEIYRGKSTRKIMVILNGKRIAGVNDFPYTILETFTISKKDIVKLMKPTKEED